MVFGVFDRLHEGHRSFLVQARAHGDELIAVVARDAVVQKLKGRAPHQSEEERCARLEQVDEVKNVLLGDEEQGSYKVVTHHEPDIICVGYDQDELYRDLRKRMIQGTLPKIRLVRTRAYKPDEFHTSLLTD